ncbi:glucosaminidase domain-containing protein [Clostridia bacterium]|nr:glucosaminidase domain-containing protein [Clostridia bacterium]
MNKEIQHRTRWIMLALIAILFLLPEAALATATTEEEDFQIFKDGVEVEAPVAPYLEEGVSYIPIRALIESLNGQVDWYGASEPFVLKLGDKNISMKLGENQAKINDLVTETQHMAQLHQETTFLPLRFVSETFGFKVNWNGEERRVDILTQALPSLGSPIFDAEEISILGEPMVTLEEMEWWFSKHVDGFDELPSLYYEIAEYYGIRPDLAIAQAIKETGCFKFGNLVLPEQNNFCGLYATGVRLTGEESIYGANPNMVTLVCGNHGANFVDQACGVEAHLQHLYAYATKKELPKDREVLDPRFNLLHESLNYLRGSATVYAYLGAGDNPNGVGWASPGIGYGYEIVDLYQGMYDEIAENRDF